MKQNLSGIFRLVAACLLLALSACGGGGEGSGNGGGASGGSGATPPPPTGIGAAGGTVTGPNGTKVEIPPGALATNVDIKIEQASSGSPALPSGFSAAGMMFAFTPHGTTFAVPVTITLPFDPAAVTAGVTPVLYKTTNAQAQWEPVANATFGANTVTASITSFSFAQPLQPPKPLERRDPIRTWTFSPFGDPPTSGPQVDFGGEMHEKRSFGTNGFFIFDNDDTRTLEAFSSADGVTFWVSAEDVGGAELRQSQKFIKRAENATLRFVVTAALLEALDGNQIPSSQECPLGLELPTCSPLNAFIQYEAEARTPLGALLLDAKGVPVLDTGGYLSIQGRAELWGDPFVGRDAKHTTTAWAKKDFDFTRNAGGLAGDRHPRARLIAPLVFNVDLSRLDVGDDFRVISTLRAFTRNARGRESAIGAYLRDPAGSRGAAMEFSGLEPVGDPTPVAPTDSPSEPCTAGPDPEAGVLQFSAATYALLEAPFSSLTNGGIFVTRTGGSKGAVSARIATGGGTAAPGVHYAPLNTRLRFADGDTEPLLIALDVLPNETNEPDTTVHLSLSDIGGCASLGAQSSAGLTIVDDDRLPPAPAPSGLDEGFGNAGTSTASAFGGDRSAMALQADGKIVIVGGTFTDFILARFNVDGGLDTSFDGDGKVTTDMVGGEQEEALGVAIQPDGKIVVVGYTGTPGPGGPSNFALARYNADGSLDTTFGTAGKVVSGVLGSAYAVAIQPDSKIVVVGDIPLSSGTDFSDFVVARYNANGTPDTSFSVDGRVTTDIGGGTNTARNVVLQPNGAILVSGEPFGSFTGSNHTDVVRYDANGSSDPGFGVGGALTLNGARVGEGLALQGDGKFVLVGGVDVGATPTVSSQFAVMRRNADGSPDNAFGTAGTVSTAFTDRGDSAFAVALQGDGKILVAGRSSSQLNSNFALARYHSNGALDTGFGNAGKLTIDFFGFTDIAESVAMQADGKIVLGGLARDNVDGYGLARINP